MVITRPLLAEVTPAAIFVVKGISVAACEFAAETLAVETVAIEECAWDVPCFTVLVTIDNFVVREFGCVENRAVGTGVGVTVT